MSRQRRSCWHVKSMQGARGEEGSGRSLAAGAAQRGRCRCSDAARQASCCVASAPCLHYQCASSSFAGAAEQPVGEADTGHLGRGHERQTLSTVARRGPDDLWVRAWALRPSRCAACARPVCPLPIVTRPPAVPAGRRTYRAHGRINAYMSSPCHIELILEEKEQAVKAEAVSSGVCS